MSDPFEIFDCFGGADTPGPSEAGAASETEGAEGRARPVRRWTSRSSTPPSTPRTGAAPDPTDPPRALHSAVREVAPTEAARAEVAPPEVDPADADLLAFRAVVVPELRASVRHLVARGHQAELAEGSPDDEPGVVVRLRVNPGPFAVRAAAAARFEVRLGADLRGDTLVVAGFTGTAVSASFTLLGRTPLRAVDDQCIRRLFVQFVERILAEQA